MPVAPMTAMRGSTGTLEDMPRDRTSLSIGFEIAHVSVLEIDQEVFSMLRSTYSSRKRKKIVGRN